MSTFANSEDPDEMQHNAFLKNYNLTPLDIVQWTIPSLLYQTKRKTPLQIVMFSKSICHAWPDHTTFTLTKNQMIISIVIVIFISIIVGCC